MVIHSKSLVLGVSLFLAFLALGIAIPVVSASSGVSGQFVAYNITSNHGGRSFSATVNESVSPSPSTTGMSVVSLQVISSIFNFSNSKFVNSSSVLFPNIPVSGNTSFSYNYHNYSISMSVTKLGSASASVGGVSYTTANYSFSAAGGKALGPKINATGQFTTFPSGLLNSADISVNGTLAVHIQLAGTNLPLNATSQNSGSTTTMAIAGGTGTILAGLGAFVFYRHEKNRREKDDNEDPNSEKPLHYVD